jgi:hypothetical protein
MTASSAPPTTEPDGPVPPEALDDPVEASDRSAGDAGGWPSAAVHRLRDLPVLERRIAIAVLVLLASLPIASSLIVLAQGWLPAGDNALIGLRVRDVLTGRWPLIGQPTTGENFGSGIPTSHPGPIEFYLVAPLVAVLGPTVGLVLGAGLINAAAMTSAAWLAFRRGGLVLGGIVAVATVVMAWSLGGNLLHDPVSSNVGTFASFALLFAAWAMVAGDLRAAPAFVAIGTFTLQDHLAYLGTGSLVVGLALVLATWWFARLRAGQGQGQGDDDSDGDRDGDRSPRSDGVPRIVLGSVVLGLVLWTPILIDEIWGTQNINAIFETFTGERTPGEGTAFAYGRVIVALGPLPIFARQIAPLGYMHTPDVLEQALGIAVLALVAGLGVVAVRRRDVAQASFVTVAAVAGLAGAYAAVKLPVGAGIQASNLHWMWTWSAFVWSGLLWMAWTRLPAVWHQALRTPMLVAGAVLLLVASVATVRSVDLATDRDGPTARNLPELYERLDEVLPEGTYRVTYEGGAAVVGVGPAIVHHLEHDGYRLLMDVGPFTRAYADHRAYEGQPVDGTLVVSSEGGSEYPQGAKLLLRQAFEVNRSDGQVNVIRLYLVPPDA